MTCLTLGPVKTLISLVLYCFGVVAFVMMQACVEWQNYLIRKSANRHFDQVGVFSEAAPVHT